MSKIGRMPISFSSAKIAQVGHKLVIEGPKAKFEHEVPAVINVHIEQNQVTLSIAEHTRKNKMLWGLHRALLANKIKGVEKGFEQKLIIVGLGYKAVATGNKVTLFLGYTHKIEYTLPAGVTLEIDKTGQQLTLKSADKFSLGNAADAIRSFRPPEPYKGTGVMREGEVIFRKAGKTKSS